MRPKLSIIVPFYNEEESIGPLYRAIVTAIDPLKITYEMVFVDDGSRDNTVPLATDLARRDPRVRLVKFRRNYGQTPAMAAGIEHARGEILVTMDGDLQNDPADIPMLLAKLNEGHDAVFGLRKNRQDRMLMRKLPSFLGNWLIRKVTGSQIKDMGCTLRAMRRELAEALPLYGEMHRFVPVLAKMHGARVTQVDVEHHPRVAGQTKYNLSRSVRVLLDLITVKFLHTYVSRPMHALGLPGLIAMGLGVVSLLATVGMKHLCNPPVFMTGNPLLLLSVMLELVGVQCISMGLLGELLARTYFESQGKSSYTVRATLNLDKPEVRKAA